MSDRNNECRVGDEMTTEKPPQITPDMAGCWLDGHYGWHNTYRVVELAEEYGFPLEAWEHAALDRYMDSDATDADTETVIGQGGLFDRATDYLNERAPEGFHFEWDMGELCLVNDGEEEW